MCHWHVQLMAFADPELRRQLLDLAAKLDYDPPQPLRYGRKIALITSCLMIQMPIHL